MAKRKKKRTAAKHRVKRNRQEPAAPCKERLQETGLHSLPDQLIPNILHWIRPKDEDQQSIWQWVCQMSATCAAFRRVIIQSGVAPLTPAVLELVVAPLQDAGPWQKEGLVKLVNTIRKSDWMGQNIKSVTVSRFLRSDQREALAAANAFGSLLTASGKLPNLTKVCLRCSPHRVPILVDNKLFLRELAREHPGLTTLALTQGVLGDNRQDYLPPRAFSRLAASLPNLLRFEIHGVFWLESNHLIAFFSNVGTKLKHLSLRIYYHRSMTGKVLETIATNCHSLVTLDITYSTIQSRQFNSILRSNGNLLHVDVGHSHCDNPRLSFDSIAEHKLESFGGKDCDWVDDDGIMKLINGQINAFGRILLTKLCISNSGVTPNGLRSVLTRWRETGQVLSLEVYAWFCEEVDPELPRDEFPDHESMAKLENDFQEVDWHFGEIKMTD